MIAPFALWLITMFAAIFVLRWRLMSVVGIAAATGFGLWLLRA